MLRVEEEQPVVVSPGREFELRAGKEQAAETIPVEPGQIEIRASLTMTFELIQ